MTSTFETDLLNNRIQILERDLRNKNEEVNRLRSQHSSLKRNNEELSKVHNLYIELQKLYEDKKKSMSELYDRISFMRDEIRKLNWEVRENKIRKFRVEELEKENESMRQQVLSIFLSTFQKISDEDMFALNTLVSSKFAELTEESEEEVDYDDDIEF